MCVVSAFRDASQLNEHGVMCGEGNVSYMPAIPFSLFLKILHYHCNFMGRFHKALENNHGIAWRWGGGERAWGWNSFRSDPGNLSHYWKLTTRGKFFIVSNFY